MTDKLQKIRMTIHKTRFNSRNPIAIDILMHVDNILNGYC